MHTEVVVDTSVWISRLTRKDINHVPSLRWMQDYMAKGGKLVAPTFLLIEVASAVARRTGRIQSAKDALQYVSAATSRFIPVDSMVNDAADIAAELKLRSGDTLFVVLAHKLVIPLISWDNEQLRRASGLIETYRPDNYPL